MGQSIEKFGLANDSQNEIRSKRTTWSKERKKTWRIRKNALWKKPFGQNRHFDWVPFCLDKKTYYTPLWGRIFWFWFLHFKMVCYCLALAWIACCLFYDVSYSILNMVVMDNLHSYLIMLVHIMVLYPTKEFWEGSTKILYHYRTNRNVLGVSIHLLCLWIADRSFDYDRSFN